jgi:4-hydroxy-tetrahydrodipicolinate synthase
MRHYQRPAGDEADNLKPMNRSLSGVLVPAVTPFDRRLEPNEKRFIAYCRWLLDHGAHGLAVFGTTSEATSLSLAERMGLLECLVEAGIAPAKLLPGTGLCALPETVALTRHAVGLGCAGVLMLPPFYYKNVSDDGLVGAYSETIERVGDSRLRVYLYHIPQMSGVGLALGVIERLLGKYPKTVVGIKDSSGDWEGTKSILKAFPQMTVFPATESRLLEGMALGAAGCISASANMNIVMIRALIDAIRGEDKSAGDMQRRVSAIRQAMEKVPAIAAIKALFAQATGAGDWAIVRPPLTTLSDSMLEDLRRELTQAGLDAGAAFKDLPH